MQVDTVYDLITIFLICHVPRIRNGAIRVGLNIYIISAYKNQTNFNYFASYSCT